MSDCRDLADFIKSCMVKSPPHRRPRLLAHFDYMVRTTRDFEVYGAMCAWRKIYGRPRFRPISLEQVAREEREQAIQRPPRPVVTTILLSSLRLCEVKARAMHASREREPSEGRREH